MVIDKKEYKKYIYLILKIFIAGGVLLHIIPFFYNRSLWLDEAMLVKSILTRNLGTLALSPLDFGQSAPIGYLYIVKILTLIFGKSEAVLRLWSLATGIGSIFMFYLMIRDCVKKHHALVFTAVFSLCGYYIKYSNEAKQYMSENFFCLLAMYLWQLHSNKKVSTTKLIVFYSIMIWFSFTAVFFIAACIIFLCLSTIKRLKSEKDGRCVLDLCKCGIVFVSFCVNYIFWLSKTSGNAGDKAYWDILRFSSLIKSVPQIKSMIWQFIVVNKYLFLIFCVMFFIYLFAALKGFDRSKIYFPFCLAAVLMLIASSLGFYPIQQRLVQVFTIFLVFFGGCCASYLSRKFNNYRFGKFLNISVNITLVAILLLSVCKGGICFAG